MCKRGEPLPINQALNRPRAKLGLDLTAWMAIVFVSVTVFLVGFRLLAMMAFPTLAVSAWLIVRKHPTGPQYPRLGEDDLDYGELWLRDDRLLPNLGRARPDAAIRQNSSCGYPLWRAPGPRGSCSDHISWHFTLEYTSPHGAWRNAKGGRLAVEHNSCAVCRSSGSGGTVVDVYFALRATGLSGAVKNFGAMQKP